MSIIAWYLTEEDAKDKINNLNGTAYNVTYDIGKRKKCGVFNGTNSVITIPNDDKLNLRYLSIAVWANFSDTSSSFIFEKGDLNTQYSLFSHGDDLVFRTFAEEDSSYHTMSYTKASLGITNGEWAHIVATYDGTYKRIYVNGVLKGEVLWANKTIRSSSAGAAIGRFGGTSTGYYFIGKLNDLQIYNHALSLKEIKELSRAKILHYKFDDPEVKDVSGLSIDPYSIGAASFRNSSDRIGGGFFYFYNTYLTATINSPIFLANEPMSICFWLYHYNYSSCIISSGKSNSYYTGNEFQLYIQSSYLRLHISENGSNSTSYDLNSPAVFESHKWHHVVVTYTKDKVVFYKNGEAIREHNSGPYLKNSYNDYNNRLIIASNGLYQYKLMGSLDDIHIYNSELKADEVKEIYKQKASIDNNSNFYIKGFLEEDIYVRRLDTNGKINIHPPDPGDSGTIICSFKVTSNSGGSAPKFFWDKYSSYLPRLFAQQTTSNTFYWEIGDGATWDVEPLITPNEWQEFTCTWNLGTCYIYVNGELAASGTYSGTTSLTDYLRIGVAWDNTRYLGPDAYVSNFSLWDVALNATEVAKYSKKRLAGSEPNLVVYYPLDEKTTSVYDKTGTQNATAASTTPLKEDNFIFLRPQNFKIGNTANLEKAKVSEVGVVDDLVAWYKLDGDTKDYSINRYDATNVGATVKYGHNKQSCYLFDGINDYLNVVGLSSIIANVGVGSVSMWFKIPDTSGSLAFMPIYYDNGDYIAIGSFAGAWSNESIGFKMGPKLMAYTNGHEFYHDGTWHHACFVIGFDFNAIYIDGVSLPLSYSSSSSTTGNCMWGSFSTMKIGNRNTDFYGRNGFLQDLRFYTKALLSEEVNTLYEVTGGSNNKVKKDDKYLYVKSLKEV